MAKKFQYSFVFKVGNLFTRNLLALGISFNGSTLITVPGRKSGLPRSTPITMIEFNGQRYVQSPFGNVDWVRNLRAAGKATLSWGRRHETVDRHRAQPRSRRPRSSSRCSAARRKMIRDYFDVTAESSLEDIVRDAPNHAVFAVHPAYGELARWGLLVQPRVDVAELPRQRGEAAESARRCQASARSVATMDGVGGSLAGALRRLLENRGDIIQRDAQSRRPPRSRTESGPISVLMRLLRQMMENCGT